MDVQGLVFNTGCLRDLSNLSDNKKIQAVYQLIQMQMFLEDSLLCFSKLSENTGKTVILLDRGTMDFSVLLKKDLWF